MLRLRRALYGLKQSGLLWNRKIVSILLNNGFQQSQHDLTLFMRDLTKAESLVIVLIYVDDLVAITASEDSKRWFVHVLTK